MSFKRVISHDELGNLSKKMSTGGENEETNEQFAPNTTTSEAPVAVIETEPNEEKDKTIPKDFRGVSTLSADDKSDALEEEYSNPGGIIISQNQLNLARLGRASSENVQTQRTGSGSSGTFGWFIDVQGGEGTPKVKEEDKKQSVKFKDDDTGDNLFSDADELTQFVDISQQNVDTGECLL